MSVLGTEETLYGRQPIKVPFAGEFRFRDFCGTPYAMSFPTRTTHDEILSESEREQYHVCRAKNTNLREHAQTYNQLLVSFISMICR